MVICEVMLALSKVRIRAYAMALISSRITKIYGPGGLRVVATG